MANSKARPRSDRTVAAVSATPTSRAVRKPAAQAPEPEPIEDLPTEQEEAQEEAKPAGQPLWLQVASFVLAILGLAISAYETYAHFNGSHLAGCTSNGAVNCT